MLGLGNPVEAVATFLRTPTLEAHYEHNDGQKDDESTGNYTSHNVEVGGCRCNPRGRWWCGG